MARVPFGGFKAVARVPLGARLLGVLLAGIALAAIPGYLVIRWATERAIERSALVELSAQADILGRVLAGASELELPSRVHRAIALVPVRVTIVDALGNVLGETLAEGRGPQINQGNQPEIRGAMAYGRATSHRTSDLSGSSFLYAATRFPQEGAPRGVVRLAVTDARVTAAIARVHRILDITAAIVLTATLLAGLAASLAVSRPLRRLVAGVRSLAGGDLGGEFDLGRSDELGQLASALTEMSSELRARLLEVGADHAAFRAVIDEAPVGVVLYDPALAPEYANGAARKLFDLSPTGELESLVDLARHPNQAAAIGHVVTSGAGEDQLLVVPWRRKVRLNGRWVPVPHEAGRPGLALIVVADPESVPRLAVFSGLERWARTLRSLASEARGAELAAEGMLASIEMDRLRTEGASPPGTDALRATHAAPLLAQLVGDARPLAAARGLTLDLDARIDDTSIVECEGRVELALRLVLMAAVRGAAQGSTVRVVALVNPTSVRVEVRHDGAPVETKTAATLIGAIGGEAESSSDGERGTAWVSLLRA